MDYVFVPYKQLLNIEDFEICLMPEMIEKLEMQGTNRIPDHSLLTWTVPLLNNDNSDYNASIQIQTEHIHVSQTVHKTSNILNTFLNDESSIPLIDHTIQKIENNLYQANDVVRLINRLHPCFPMKWTKSYPRKT